MLRSKRCASIYTLFLFLIRMLIVCVETIYTLAKNLFVHTCASKKCFSLSLSRFVKKKIRNFRHIYLPYSCFSFHSPVVVIEFQGIIVVAAYTRLLLFSRHWGLVFFVIYIRVFSIK